MNWNVLHSMITTGFLERWLMARICQCSRGIQHLKFSSSWTQRSVWVLSNWTIPLYSNTVFAQQNCKPSYIAYLIFWGKKNEHVTKWNILFYNWLWFITAFWYDSFRSAYLKSVESACKFLFIMNFTKICISKR